ncbi:hypothetical protein [Paucilactobacillus kaifaensis]|uniref:hypothetical protein n=1 Tax=Paucilactobacillus kaifaensis TaxID=2559921 RepID=UPI0010F7BB29|nr:hypothetical protein [Paucilactobacillus kaifaensis]
MKINVQTFVDQILADKFQTKKETVTVKQVEETKAIEAGLKYLSDNANKNELSQFEWIVKVPAGENVSVRLETSVINLPLMNSKTITKILDVNEEREVNVYLVCEAADLNRSGLRIDQCASLTSLADDPDSAGKMAKEWITTQLTTIESNRAAAKEEKK